MSRPARNRKTTNRSRPTAKKLEREYRAMAQDAEREAEALEWAEALIGDVADEPDHAAMNPIRQDLLQAIAALSRAHPDMRLGQWIVALSLSATDKPDAMYDVEDEDLLAAAKRFLERNGSTVHTRAES